MTDDGMLGHGGRWRLESEWPIGAPSTPRRSSTRGRPWRSTRPARRRVADEVRSRPRGSRSDDWWRQHFLKPVRQRGSWTFVPYGGQTSESVSASSAARKTSRLRPGPTSRSSRQAPSRVHRGHGHGLCISVHLVCRRHGLRRASDRRVPVERRLPGRVCAERLRGCHPRSIPGLVRDAHPSHARGDAHPWDQAAPRPAIFKAGIDPDPDCEQATTRRTT